MIRKQIQIFFFFIFAVQLQAADIQEQNDQFSIIGYESYEYQRDNILKNIDKANGTEFSFRSGLEILTPGIDNARVYLGDEKIGETPCEFNDLNIGYHRITLEKAGYEPLSLIVHNSIDQRVVVKARLIKSSGMIIINNIPEDTILLIDGLSVSDFPMTLDYGPHSIQMFRNSVLISESRFILQEPDLSLDYEQIYNRVSHVSLSFNRYNPNAIQDSKNLSLQTDLTIPLEVKLLKNDEIIDESVWIDTENGTIPLEDLFPELKTMEDGVYQIVCTSGDLGVGEVRLFIDRFSTRLPRSLNSGSGGLLLCPLPDTLPAYTGEFRTTIAPIFFTESNDFFLDSGFGFRYAFPRNWEIHLSVLIQYSLDLNDLAFGPQLSIKKRIVTGAELFSLAVGVSGGYWAPIANYASNNYQFNLWKTNGYSVFMPMELGSGPWKLAFSPQLNLYPVSDPYKEQNADSFSGASLNAAFNLGFEWVMSQFTIGISGRIRSPLLTDYQADLWTFDIAAETCIRFSPSVSAELGVLYGYNFGNPNIGGLFGMSFIP